MFERLHRAGTVLIVLLLGAAIVTGADSAGAAVQTAAELRGQLVRARRLQVVGRYDEAKELYKRLYERHPTSEAVIREYGETLMMSKDYGVAEKLYLEVRERDNKPLAYAAQLERIHLHQGRYRDAAGDCLDVLAAGRGKIDWVRGELAKISGEAEGGVDLVLEVITLRADALPSFGEYRTLGVEMLVRASRPVEAGVMLEAMRETEEISSAALHRLGIQLENLGEVSLAIASLRMALERQGNVSSISGASFMLAKLFAAQGRADQARIVLQNLASRYPSSAIAFKAQLQVAALESDVLGRPDRALTLYEDLLDQKKLPVQPGEVRVAMGKCLLMMGRLAEARELYAGLAAEAAKPNPGAQYMAAEVSFYMGETDSALSLYSTLASEHPDWELANDAIDRVFLLQENAAPGPGADTTGDVAFPSGPLGLYATAERLTTIGRPDSALGYIFLIVNDHRDSPLVDDAVFRAAELHLLLGGIDQAIAACTAVADESPDERLASIASEKLGDIWWEEKGDGRRALEEYTKGLDRYPNSLVAPRVRDKVARLRREVG